MIGEKCHIANHILSHNKSILLWRPPSPTLSAMSQKSGYSNKEDALRSKQIDKKLNDERKRLHSTPVSKLLLLGPVDSGKSAVLKQMKILHGDSFSDGDRIAAIPKIFGNILDSLVRITTFFSKQSSISSPVKERLQPHIDTIQNFSAENNSQTSGEAKHFPPIVVAAIKSLWDEASIQDCIGRGSEFGLMDNTK